MLHRRNYISRIEAYRLGEVQKSHDIYSPVTLLDGRDVRLRPRERGRDLRLGQARSLSAFDEERAQDFVPR